MLCWNAFNTNAGKYQRHERLFFCTFLFVFHGYFDVIFLLFTGKQSAGISFVMTTLAIGGSLLFLLTIAVIVSCVVHRKRLKGFSLTAIVLPLRKLGLYTIDLTLLNLKVVVLQLINF